MKKLVDKLIDMDENNEDCCVCLDVLKEPVITMCSHVFCRRCIEEVRKVGLIGLDLGWDIG